MDSRIFQPPSWKSRKNTVKKPVVIYSDGCTYQNRNAILSKIPGKGHTHMECDSVHAAIECALRRRREVFLPSQMAQLSQEARKTNTPYRVKILDHSFFSDFTQEQSYPTIQPGRGTGDPVVKDIRGLRYDPKGFIQYKLNFKDGWSDLPHRTRGSVAYRLNQNLPRLYSDRLPIPKDKYLDLQHLKQFIPKDCHAFFGGIPHEEDSRREKKRRAKDEGKSEKKKNP